LSVVGRKAEALPLYEKLVAEFEKSEYLEVAKKRIEEIKAANPADAPATTAAAPPAKKS
jgi:hypothetical protein